MEQHGVKFTADIDRLRRSMESCHIAYLHAPLFNPALKAVAPIRKSLGVRSFFNMLGPLVNPVMPTYQLLGVYNLPLLRLYSYTYQESGTRFAVVHSLDGYDEISLTAEFKVAMPEKEKLYTPEMLGFSRTTEAELDGGESSPTIIPDEQMARFRFMLDYSEEAICMNSAPLARGEKVRVVKGPLTGLVGELVTVDGRSKIAVRLNMLGCACADMPVGYVESITY